MDIGSLYGDYLKSMATSASNLERNLNGTSKESSDDELLDACKQFETYFYELVFRNMEKAMVPKDDSDPNGTLIDFHKENLLTEYSKMIVEQSGDNSLAHQLYEQMKRNYAIKIDEAAPSDALKNDAATEAVTPDEN